jgi:hypothetical protein
MGGVERSGEQTVNFPIVDILYFAGTMVLVTGMGIFIVRSMRSKNDEESDSANRD